MKLFIRIFIVIDLLFALVAVPIIIAGFGFGAGGGGSSFAQKTNLQNSTDDQLAALTLLKRVCDEEDWKKSMTLQNDPSFPKDKIDIQKLYQNQRISTLCQPKKDGIVFQNNSAGEEMNFLFQDLWDRRILYSLVYLHQKRFSNSGYNVNCGAGTDKAVPEMTVSVTSDWQRDPFLNSAGSIAIKDSQEDDISKTTPDKNNISPHARGQALDIITFGCLEIKDSQGTTKYIPTQISLGQNYHNGNFQTPTSASLLSGLGPLIGQNQDTLQTLADVLNNPASFYQAGLSAGVNAQSENMIGPLNLVSVGATSGANSPQNNLLTSFISASENAGAQGTFDPATALAGSSIEAKLNLPAGSLQNGAEDAKQIGTNVISQALNFNNSDLWLQEKDKTKINPEKEKTLEKMLVTASDEMLSLPAGTVELLKKKQYDEAAALAGARTLSERLNFEISSSDFQLIVKTGRLPRSVVDRLPLPLIGSVEQGKMLEAMVRGGYKDLSGSLDQVDSARRSGDTYQLALALLNAPSQTDTQLQDLRDFLSADPVRRDGAARRYQGDPTISEWMRKNLNLSNEILFTCQQLVLAYENSANPRDEMRSFTASYKDQLLSIALTQLPREYQLIISQTVGTYPPTTAQLEQATKDGTLRRSAEIMAMTQLLTRAGLDISEAQMVAMNVTGEQIGAQTALNIINGRYGINLTVADFKDKNELGLPVGVAKIAYGAVGSLSGLNPFVIEGAVRGDRAAQASLARAAGDRFHVPAFLVEAVINSDLFQVSKAGAENQAKRVGKQIGKTDSEKDSISNSLKDAFNDLMGQAKTAGQAKAMSILMDQGMSPDDAGQISDGHFKDADKAVIATVLSRQGIPYNLSKKIISGEASASEKYGLSDALLAPILSQAGIDTISTHFTESLIGGSEGARNDMAKGIGAELMSQKLAEQAAQIGVYFDQQQAAELLKNEDWQALGEFGKGTLLFNVSDQLSQHLYRSSGGWVDISADEIQRRIDAGDYSGLDKWAKEAGKSNFAVLVSETSRGTISTETARQMIDNWGSNPKQSLTALKDAGSQVGKNLAAQKLSETTGGVISPNQVLDLYEKARTTGLTGADAENVGWGVMEKYTGFSKAAFDNFDENFKTLKDNYTKQFTDFQGTANSLGAGIIVNTLLGETLVKIDPTGGLLAAFGLGWAQTQVMSLSLGGPYLLALAFLINPQATFASVQAMFNQVTTLLTNPYGFVMNLLSLFGFNRPQTSVIVRNTNFAKQNIIDMTLFEKSGSSTKNQADQNTGQTQSGATSQGQGAAAGQNASSQAAQGASPVNLASQSANSDYVLKTERPNMEYFQQVSRRTTDQIAEDMMLFSLVSQAKAMTSPEAKNFVENHWNRLMKLNSSSQPISPLDNQAIKQMLPPRLLAAPQKLPAASGADYFYKDEGTGLYKTVAYLTTLAQSIFGSSYNIAKLDGRKPGIIYSKKITDYFHVGF